MASKNLAETVSMKIDAYSHFMPPKYREAISRALPEPADKRMVVGPPFYDLDCRFHVMDKFEPIRQVITCGVPPSSRLVGQAKALELTKIANDELAALVLKYPDRFAAAIASLPMDNIEAALEETDRAINDLGLKGIFTYTSVEDKPLDLPEFIPLYEKMSRYDLPIYTHPMRPIDYPDYRTENTSKYAIAATFGWPYETTVAMTRLVYSGILEKYPNLKVVTHHCGGMIPYYAGRLAGFSLVAASEGVPLSRGPVDYFKMFYNDTALHGHIAGLTCAYAFFGAEHLLFGTDFPLGDGEHGEKNYRETIYAIEHMDITEAERRKIYVDNVRNLLHLS